MWNILHVCKFHLFNCSLLFLYIHITADDLIVTSKVVQKFLNICRGNVLHFLRLRWLRLISWYRFEIFHFQLMDAEFENSDDRKIRFRVKNLPRSYCSSMDSKVDDFHIRRPPLRRWQTDDFRPKRREERIKGEPTSFHSYLRHAIHLSREELFFFYF
jgi:hypothetical protein